MGNFQFLLPEFSAVFESASKAESLAITDPRTACFYARRALELAVSWAYKFDSGLKLPYQDNISTLIHEPTFKQITGDAVFNKAKVIVTLGNRAVHHHRPIPQTEFNGCGQRIVSCLLLAGPFVLSAEPSAVRPDVRSGNVADDHTGTAPDAGTTAEAVSGTAEQR